ncbi:MAG: hypothetical protein DRH21_07745 [Deltaproteobacteria bacterium]|nr:MAG: hypothetical protein DRH21_07745 [Deltaproteobacteria bacterium]
MAQKVSPSPEKVFESMKQQEGIDIDPLEYNKLHDTIKTSEGLCTKTAGLVYENKQRTPLENCDLPIGAFSISYQVINQEIIDISPTKRLLMKITVPTNLSEEELSFNFKHCMGSYFNKYKPDSVVILAYLDSDKNRIENIPLSAGTAIFAPFGDLGRVQEGFIDNISVQDFEYSMKFSPDYF